MERLLLITNRNPRVDPRTAEAVRIAAGIGAWKKVQVNLLLQTEAVYALDEFAGDLVDGNLLQEYLPAIQEHGGEIYVERSNPLLKNINSPLPVRELSEAETREMVRLSKYSMTL